MNHQPYETWILDNPPITEEEKQDLNIHIQECPDCSHLHQGWNLVEQSIRSSQIHPAPSNFTQRWSASLERRKREQEKKQARTLVLALVSGALAVGITLCIMFLPEFSLISLTAGFISTILSLFTGIENFWSILLNLAQTVSPTTLIITVLVISGWVILASFTLGLSIWKLAFNRGERK